MKTIIAGSRTITDLKIVESCISKALNSGFIITEVVCGGAKGVDTLGRVWSKNNKIPVKMFPAEWDRYGKSAGYRRNVDMADYAEALVLIWDGESKGSRHMLNIANEKKLQIFVNIINEKDDNILFKECY